MATDRQPRVLVVGAGPVGLAAACELAGREVAVRIVDDGEGPSRTSKALGVQARTLEVFADLGVAREAIERGRRADALVLHPDRFPPIRVPLAGLDTPFPFVLILPQSETERLLEARLAELGVEVERRTKLVAVTAAGSTVAGKLEGPRGAEDRESAWLVACDGARSTVRRALGLPFEGSPYPEEFLLADTRARGLPGSPASGSTGAWCRPCARGGFCSRETPRTSTAPSAARG